jgi:hypothetical protein
MNDWTDEEIAIVDGFAKRCLGENVPVIRDGRDCVNIVMGNGFYAVSKCESVSDRIKTLFCASWCYENCSWEHGHEVVDVELLDKARTHRFEGLIPVLRLIMETHAKMIFDVWAQDVMSPVEN